MNDAGAEQTLALSDADRVEALRAEFERAWRAGAVPRIEDYLKLVEDGLRLAAFRELLKADVSLRRGRQESPSVDDYLGQFPGFEAAIREACWPGEDGAGDGVAPRAKPGSGLRVRCPHCDNPIELVPDAELESIRCTTCGSNFSLTGDSNATRDARSVAQVGHFKLVERLGMGAFGTVWKAQDTELDRTVAIKIPRAGQLDKQRQDFFLREARSAAQLRHPNIVSVYEVGRDGDTLYIVSELVRGVSLADRLTTGSMAARDAAELCATIADALHHAHEQGVIHRDLKPANVMLDATGEPYLMDFGLARREANEITMTLDGQVLGTPSYMSPEQAQGEAHVADRRSDVYSLGVMLFEMLTGELPFRGNVRMLLHQVVHDDPPRPRKLNPGVSRDLETICLKCLEKQPARGYPAAIAVADDLRHFLHDEPIAARQASRLDRTWRWCRRKPVLAMLNAAVLMLIIVTTILLWRMWVHGQLPGKRQQQVLAAELHDDIQQLIHSIETVATESDVGDAAQNARLEAVAYRNRTDLPSLESLRVRLQSQLAELQQEYRLLIVSNGPTGFPRKYSDEAGTRESGYYVIVEPTDANGNLVPQLVLNRETGVYHRVSSWAEQVPEEIFERLRADKDADGVLDEREFAVKVRGESQVRIALRGSDGKPIQRGRQITEY